MKGLEITIYDKSKILCDNDEFRIDAEYYQKQYLNLYKQIEGSPMLVNLTFMSDLSSNGSFAAVKAIKDDNNPKVVPFIRSGNVGDTFIEESDLEFISKEAHSNLPKSTTELHEIMMARKGKIGGASIIMEDEVDFNCSENVIKLRILEKDELNPFYFTSFFNSKYGLKQVERLSTGNVQPWVSIFQIRKLMIPILDINFQNEIERIITLAHKKNNQSKNAYSVSEKELLKVLGLANLELPKKPINIKSYSNSFGLTGRLDAEYYQPHFDIIENKVKQNGFSLLKDICSEINYGTVPTSPYTDDGNGVPYIKGMNLKNTEIVKTKLDRLSDTEDLPDKFYTKKGDIVISQMGTVGDVGVVRDEIGWLFASFTIRARLIKNSGFDPVFVGLYIQNVAKPFYLYRNIAQASVRQNTDLPTIRNLYLPNVVHHKQQQIAEKVEESFALKKQSEHLLEVAKRAVEIAIEEGENKGLEYINLNTKNLN